MLIKEKSYQSIAAIFLKDEGKCLIEEYKILKGTEARFYKTIWDNVKYKNKRT